MQANKIYISGYISDGGRQLSELELEVCRAKFERSESRLKLFGYEPVNPMKIVPADAEYCEAMRICIRAMTSCASIYFMDDYTYSRGAKNEYIIAEILQLKIYHEGTNHEPPTIRIHADA